jgi:hypothetical protein
VIDLKSILEMKMSQICMRGGCGNGKLLIVLARSHLYIANLQTGTMHEVEDDMSSSECMTVVGLETDWRTTFFPARYRWSWAVGFGQNSYAEKRGW